MGRIFLIIYFVFLASIVMAQDSIELTYNMQRPGGDYTSFQANNAAECSKKCEVSERCQAFDFHKSDSSCWLKDRVYQTRPYQGVVSGAKIFRQPSSVRSTSSKMELSFDTHRPGGDYTRFPARNYQACAEDCRKDPGCVAFDFTTVDSMCYMKNWEPPSNPYKGVVSGVKRQKNSMPARSSDQIRSVQRILAEQGYNPGPVDGMMGKRTRVAIKQYQRDYDLPVTGRLDDETLASLETTQVPPAAQPPKATQETVVLSPSHASSLTKGDVVDVAIFPWALNGDSNSFISILKENINYRVGELENFRLKKSYYKIKGIPRLNVGESYNFYSWDNKANIKLVQQTAKEHNIDFAILGTMDIHCRWSDACQVREMEIMLIDTKTGVITAVEGGSWNEDAREYVASNVTAVFNKLKNELNIR